MDATMLPIVVIGGIITLLCILFIMYVIYRANFPQDYGDHTVFFPSQPTEVYREELNDSFAEVALWRCGVCHFGNHPDRKQCDLCQTVRRSIVGVGEINASDKRVVFKNSKKESIPMLSEDTQRLSHASQYSNLHQNLAFSKLQLAASRRQLWKRMPTADGLHRWVRERMKPRESLDSNTSRKSKQSDHSHSDEHRQSIGYIRVRDSTGNLVLNESDMVATDFHYRINIMDGNGTSELTMNLEGVHNLPFSSKLRWFSTELHRLWLPWECGHGELAIRRDHILEDSFKAVSAMKPFQLRQRWRVMFVGEPGLDAGGIMREWLTLLFAELFDPELGLFVSTVGDDRSYWINANSDKLCDNHVALYKFVGRMLGKAILEEHLVPVYFALPFMKHILGIPISFSDLQFLDEIIYNSALAIKQTNDVETLCLDFTVTRLVNGRPEVIELIENGANMDVTEANKDQYLDLLFRHHVLGSVSRQMLAFLSAFYEVVPEGLIKLFDYQELELLICGVPCIDVTDWQKHSDYKFSTNNQPTKLEHLNIRWFWEIVEDMPNDLRARLLQFTTGSARVPAQGFKGLICSDGRVRQFNIQFTGFNLPNLFPKAHTCFNRLDLPVYPTKEVMGEYLTLVVHMDITGFTIE